MGAVVEIWFEYLIPFLLKDSHIVQWFNQLNINWLLELKDDTHCAHYICRTIY